MNTATSGLGLRPTLLPLAYLPGPRIHSFTATLKRVTIPEKNLFQVCLRVQVGSQITLSGYFSRVVHAYKMYIMCTHNTTKLIQLPISRMGFPCIPLKDKYGLNVKWPIQGRNFKTCIYYLCVYAHIRVHVWGQKTACGGVGPLLSLCGFQVLNSGCCVWWQVTLPAEPTHWVQECFYLSIYLFSIFGDWTQPSDVPGKPSLTEQHPQSNGEIFKDLDHVSETSQQVHSV